MIIINPLMTNALVICRIDDNFDSAKRKRMQYYRPASVTMDVAENTTTTTNSV